jgi:hypothetical protein
MGRRATKIIIRIIGIKRTFRRFAITFNRKGGLGNDDWVNPVKKGIKPRAAPGPATTKSSILNPK